jgi:hypothetical protein
MNTVPKLKTEDEIARYYWPHDSGSIPAWLRAAISDAVDMGIAFAVRRARESSLHSASFDDLRADGGLPEARAFAAQPLPPMDERLAALRDYNPDIDEKIDKGKP